MAANVLAAQKRAIKEKL
jgi:hypothetical protein